MLVVVIVASVVDTNAETTSRCFCSIYSLEHSMCTAQFGESTLKTYFCIIHADHFFFQIEIIINVLVRLFLLLLNTYVMGLRPV